MPVAFCSWGLAMTGVWLAVAAVATAAALRQRPWSPRRIREHIIAQARAKGLDPMIALAFAQAETGCRNLVGDQGRSFGPFQLRADYHLEGVDPLDPAQTIPVAIDLIQRLLERTGGDVLAARVLYVCGSMQACSDDKLARIERRLAEAFADVGQVG